MSSPDQPDRLSVLTEPHCSPSEPTVRDIGATSGVLLFAAVLAGVLSVDLGPFEHPEWEPLRALFFIAIGVGGTIAARNTSLSDRGRAERLLIAAFCWLGLSSVLSADPVGGALVAAALLGTFLAGAELARSTSRSDLWQSLAAGTSAVMVAAAILGPTDGDARWAGLSEEPNALAVIAAFTVVIAVVRGIGPVSGAAAALAGVTLYATNAALPLLAAVVGVALWTSREWPTAAKRAVAVAGTGVATAFILAVVALPSEALPGDGYNLETINERTEIWSYLGERVAEAPLFGQGPRAASDVAARGAFDVRVHWGPRHAHNAALELAVAGGLPSAALFIAGVAAAIQGARRSSDTAALAIATTFAILAVTEPLVRDPTIAVLLLGVAVVRSLPPAEHATTDQVARTTNPGEPARRKDETSMGRP